MNKKTNKTLIEENYKENTSIAMHLRCYEFRTPPRRLQINLTRRVSVRTSHPKDVTAIRGEK